MEISPTIKTWTTTKMLKMSSEKLTQLQTMVGANLHVALSHFTNHSGTYSTTVFDVSVKNLEDIRNVLKAAISLGLSVRGSGSGHDPASNCIDPGQILVHLRDLQRFDGPRIELHEGLDKFGFRTMTVSAGVSQKELLDFFTQHKLYLPGATKQAHLQVVDLLSAPHHGTFLSQKCASSYVTQVRFVDSGGRLRVITEEKNPEVMKFLKCNLGACGILYDATFRLRPMSHVETSDTFDDVESILLDNKQLKKTVEANAATEIYWFPYNSCHFGKDWEPKDDKVWVKSIKMVQNPAELTDRQTDFNEAFTFYPEDLSQLTPEALVGATRRGAMMSSRMLDCRGEITQKITHAMYSWPEKLPFPVQTIGFSFPLDADYNIVKHTINILCQKLKEFNQKNEYPVNAMIQVQFSGASDAYLGPVSGSGGQTLYVYLLCLTQTGNWEEFVARVSEEWLELASARPCLHTEWATVPNACQFMRKNCRQELIKFRQTRQELELDPHNIFLNDACKQLLYSDPSSPK